MRPATLPVVIGVSVFPTIEMEVFTATATMATQENLAVRVSGKELQIIPSNHFSLKFVLFHNFKF